MTFSWNVMDGAVRQSSFLNSEPNQRYRRSCKGCVVFVTLSECRVITWSLFANLD